MTSKALPDTRKAAILRTFFLVTGIAAIVGIADAVREIFWMSLSSTVGVGEPWPEYLQQGLRFAGWALLGYVAWVVVRRRAVPPTWAILALPAVIWGMILARHVTG